MCWCNNGPAFYSFLVGWCPYVLHIFTLQAIYHLIDRNRFRQLQFVRFWWFRGRVVEFFVKYDCRPYYLHCQFLIKNSFSVFSHSMFVQMLNWVPIFDDFENLFNLIGQMKPCWYWWLDKATSISANLLPSFPISNGRTSPPLPLWWTAPCVAPACVALLLHTATTWCAWPIWSTDRRAICAYVMMTQNQRQNQAVQSAKLCVYSGS